MVFGMNIQIQSVARLIYVSIILHGTVLNKVVVVYVMSIGVTCFIFFSTVKLRYLSKMLVD